MKGDCYYCESLLGVGNGTFTLEPDKQSVGPERDCFKFVFS